MLFVWQDAIILMERCRNDRKGADSMKKAALNSNQLKLIAIAAMTLDHLVWTICPGYSRVWWVLLAHIIGRLTAPIMWYFIAEFNKLCTVNGNFDYAVHICFENNFSLES